jgi:hypothetical protein
MVDARVPFLNKSATWFASSGSPYGGSLSLRNYFAVIIAVAENEDFSSNVLVSTMLHDISVIENGINVTSFRSEIAVPLVENEILLKYNNSSQPVINMAMRMQPDVVIFDALFPFNYSDFKGYACYSQMGYRVFYFIPASGNNEEELRDSAIKGYLDLTKLKDLGFVDRLIVTKTNDLDALEAFTFTEFSFK